jgi:hypothetical protein
MAKKTARKIAAKVIIHRPDLMSLVGRKWIAKWLNNTAKDLVKLGDRYAKTFTANYYYKD